MTAEETRRLLPALIDLARRAGEEIMDVYAQDFEVVTKDDESPLTAADRASHAVLSQGLAELTPEIPLLSEEGEQHDFATRRAWNRYWLIDPLDGTREFVKRNGEFTVNIALIADHQPVIGVVYAPVLDKLWYGSRDGGAFLIENGAEREIRTRAVGDTIIAVVSRSHRGERVDTLLERIDKLDTLSVGSSLKFCMVAEGKADIYPRFGPTSEWDTGAAHCVVEAAGGRVSKADLSPLPYNSKESLLNPDFIVVGDPAYDWARYLEGLEGEER